MNGSSTCTSFARPRASSGASASAPSSPERPLSRLRRQLPRKRWSILALRSSTAQRGRWLAAGETEGALGLAAALQRAIPIAPHHVRRPHLDPVLAGVADQLGGLVEAHRLA